MVPTLHTSSGRRPQLSLFQQTLLETEEVFYKTFPAARLALPQNLYSPIWRLPFEVADFADYNFQPDPSPNYTPFAHHHVLQDMNNDVTQTSTTMFDEPLVASQPFEEKSESSQMKQWLSDLLRDQVKRKALLKLRGLHAQSWIDCLNDFILDPEIRRSAEPWLLKHTVIILRKLCEVSTLYPTCYVLGDIHDITPKCGGGFGDICQGYFKGQPLCLKVVRIYQDSNITRLLRAHAREAILWGQLDHPNTVPFYGIFYMERKERICLVAPWMKNGDIVEYLQRTPDAPRKPLIDDIANGLHYLHSKNIVHGDLKGRNVLIDDHQRACLADFGLSTILTNETLGFARTTTTVSGHTTRWASPELLEEYARPTRESDVWAFGCLCYEVLTGLEPFAGCSDISVIAKLMRGQLPAPLDNIRLHSNEKIDKKLRNLIGMCWSIKIERRPQYAEILQQLEVENLLQQSKGHSLKNPDQFWLRPPENPDIFGRFRDLLEQLYHRDRMDDVMDVEDPLSTPEHLGNASEIRDCIC